jgi:ABC-type branched-subunit amino acid transport system permease subunit
VIGAGFLTLVAEFLGAKFVYDYLTILGVVIIVVVLILPRGIMSLGKGKRGEAK